VHVCIRTTYYVISVLLYVNFIIVKKGCVLISYPLTGAVLTQCSSLIGAVPSMLAYATRTAATPRRFLSLFECQLMYPSLEERVASFEANTGTKPQFLQAFPKDAAYLIEKTIFDIIHEYSPFAAAGREHAENLVIGISIPALNKELVKRLPWVKLSRHFPGGPSDDVIAHLLSPPHKGRTAAKQYRSKILTKLARGRNDRAARLPYVFDPLCLCVNHLLILLSRLTPSTLLGKFTKS
jgi:hypothetical protein